MKDTAIFDGTSTRPSTLDVGGLSLKSVTIAAGYTGTITLDNSLTVSGNLSSYSQANGTVFVKVDKILAITAAGTDTNTFSWTGGTLKGDQNQALFCNVTTSTNTRGTIAGTGEKTLDAVYLTLGGISTWSDAGDIKLKNTATFKIKNTLTATGLGGIFSPAGTFGNRFLIDIGSVFDSQPSAGSRTIDVYTENYGNVMVNGAGLIASRGSASGGVFTIANAAGLWFSGSQIHSLDGATLTGTGQAYFVNGTRIQIANTVNAVNISDTLSTVDGAGTLKVSGQYIWFGGTWQGTGTTEISASANLTITTGGSVALKRKLLNKGTVTWLLGDIAVSDSGEIDNAAGGVFDIQVDAKILAGANAGKFKNNAGATLKKSAGMGTATIELEPEPQLGTIHELSGKIHFTKKLVNQGVIQLSGNGLICDAGFEQVGGSTSLGTNMNVTVEVTGAFTISGGTIAVMNYGNLITVTGWFEQSGGQVTLGGNGGQLSVTGTATLSGGTLTIQTGVSNDVLTASGGVQVQSGGTLVGMSGRIVGNVTNAGSISLGDGAFVGVLDISGSYTQTGTGTLRTWLGGTAPGLYSQLRVTGLATFAGSLVVGAVNGFIAHAISAFPLITYGGHNGVFDNISYPPIHYPGHWEPEYGSFAFVLQAVL